MRKAHIDRPLIAAATAAAIFLPLAAASQTINPQPLPPKTDFPTRAPIIDGWIQTSDTAAMRTHAWKLWDGMGSPSGQILNGQNLPVWETWFGTDDLFPPAGPAAAGEELAFAAAAAPRTTLRSFVSPRQFHHGHAKLQELAPGSAADQVVSFNKFNLAAGVFITMKHPGPGGAFFNYNRQASLQALSAAFPAGTSGQDRGIKEFPVQAMELKPVFSVVKATGLTPQPLWRGPSGATNKTNPTPSTWQTCVLIDPGFNGELRPATSEEIARAGAAPQLACKTYFYGSLSLFYSFKMTAAEAAAFNNAQGGSATAGDSAVLVAMHVNTKEIPFWTWQTFWWQPGEDAPNDFPGSKKNQPASLPAPWRNYASCVSYDQTTKPGGSTMDVCFNPYLETSPNIPAGITSNCISCHGTARVANDESYPPSYTKPIAFFTDPAYFNSSSVHTDFSWAIPGDSN